MSITYDKLYKRYKAEPTIELVELILGVCQQEPKGGKRFLSRLIKEDTELDVAKCLSMAYNELLDDDPALSVVTFVTKKVLESDENTKQWLSWATKLVVMSLGNNSVSEYLLDKGIRRSDDTGKRLALLEIDLIERN